MLTHEEKAKMINHRIKEYEVKIFEMKMNREAFLAVNDGFGVKAMDERIEALEKAIKAVRSMINADTDNNDAIA